VAGHSDFVSSLFVLPTHVQSAVPRLRHAAVEAGYSGNRVLWMYNKSA